MRFPITAEISSPLKKMQFDGEHFLLFSHLGLFAVMTVPFIRQYTVYFTAFYHRPAIILLQATEFASFGQKNSTKVLITNYPNDCNCAMISSLVYEHSTRCRLHVFSLPPPAEHHVPHQPACRGPTQRLPSLLRDGHLCLRGDRSGTWPTGHN